MEESVFTLSLWAESIGWMPFERATAHSLSLGLPPPPFQVEDVLVPGFNSRHRKSTLLAGTFNLAATMIGGGLMSIPYAFEKCGIFSATILVLTVACLTDRSLYLLCLCARRAGVRSYGEVGWVAFGPWMEKTIAVVLSAFLFLVTVTYMSLIRHIWGSLVRHILPGSPDNIVLLGCLLVMSPFLVLKDLYALRFNSYAGLLSTVALLVTPLCFAVRSQITALLEASPDSTQDNNEDTTTTSTTMNQIANAFVALPIISLSFTAVFNVLHVQAELYQPTKRRVAGMIRGAVLITLVVTYAFGLAGNLFFGSSTEPSVLHNLDKGNQPLYVWGCLGYGLTVLLATAILIVPCRLTLLEVFHKCVQQDETDSCTKVKELLPDGFCDEDEETATTFRSRSTIDEAVHEGTALIGRNNNHHELHDVRPCNFQGNPWVHYGSTFLIAASCYAGAVLTPGLIVTWSLCGSFLVFFIAYILPAACYLQIQRRQPTHPDGYLWIAFSWTLLTVSVVGTVAWVTAVLSNGTQQSIYWLVPTIPIQ